MAYPSPQAKHDVRRRSPRLPVGRLPLLLILVSLFGSTAGASIVGAQAVTISGTVYQDFNFNGVRDTGLSVPNVAGGTIGLASDRGVQGVLVQAFDSGNNLVGQATSDASGAYSLSPSGAGPYRVEFVSLPAGFEPGPQGLNNSTTIRFLSGSATGIDLGVSHPADYCQNAPTMLISCYSFGNQTAANGGTLPGGGPPPDVRGDSVIRSFPYIAGSNSNTATDYDLSTPTTVQTALNVGTTWGIAYARAARTVYAAAFMKKHAGFGPGGPTAIYLIDRDTNALKGTFTVPGPATNLHTTVNDYIDDNGSTAFGAVGKTALGGIAISDDEQTLYAVNLENRTIYSLNATTGALVNSQAIPTGSIPLAPAGPASPALPATCAPGDVRPFALKFHYGQLYLGLVCSGESTNAATLDLFVDGTNGCPANGIYDEKFTGGGYTCAGETFVDRDGNGAYNIGDARQLQAYVYQVNPATLALGAAPIFTFPLNYQRGFGNKDTTINTASSAVWNPWTPSYRGRPAAPENANFQYPVYPQPWLTDIEFDGAGVMLIGLRDRYGDQMGNGTYSNPADPATLYYGVAAGDTLRACSSSGAWALESNGGCGGVGGTAAQQNGQGPGGGEFYSADQYDPFHDEVTLGGNAQVPGYPDAVVTVFDPFPGPGQIFDSGLRWFSNTDGSLEKGYRLVNGDPKNIRTFGKAGGLGDILALCDAAPIEIGNRVWYDTNGNGIQDANDVPIPGIRVQLIDPVTKAVIAEAITDGSGNYYFSNDTNRPSAPDQHAINGLTTLQFGTQYQISIPLDQPGLNGWFVTRQQSDGSPGGTTRDSNGDNAFAPAGSTAVPGSTTSYTFTLGAPGQDNHTYDFGFTISPTAISLARLTAERDGDGAVVSWDTAAEVNLAGFKVYRSDTGARADAYLATPQLISASGRGKSGSSYRWYDGGAPPPAGVRYWLAAVDLDGTEAEYGPASLGGGTRKLDIKVFLPDIRR